MGTKKARDSIGTWSPIDALKPWDKNPKHHDAEHVRNVARSIRKLGWGAPIVARTEDGEIVAGHRRELAARLLMRSWERATPEQREAFQGEGKNAWHPEAVRTASQGEVPVRFGTWTPEQAHLLALADNKHNEDSAYDDAKLQEALRAFDAADLEVVGYTEPDVIEAAFDVTDDGLLIEEDPPDDSSGGGGDSYTYSVIVDFTDEGEQAALLAELEERGLKCRMLIS